MYLLLKIVQLSEDMQQSANSSISSKYFFIKHHPWWRSIFVCTVELTTLPNLAAFNCCHRLFHVFWSKFHAQFYWKQKVFLHRYTISRLNQVSSHQTWLWLHQDRSEPHLMKTRLTLTYRWEYPWNTCSYGVPSKRLSTYSQFYWWGQKLKQNMILYCKDRTHRYIMKGKYVYI